VITVATRCRSDWQAGRRANGPRGQRAGNITFGRHAGVAAGSLVLKPVGEGVLVAGSPALVIDSVADTAFDATC